MDAIRDRDLFVRSYAVDAISNAGKAANNTVPLLIEALKQTNDEYFRSKVVNALGKIGYAAAHIL